MSCSACAATANIALDTLEFADGPDPAAPGAPPDELVLVKRELRRISEQLLYAQEIERQRIAVELHDSTCQHLAVLRLGLSRLRNRTRNPARIAVLDEMSLSLGEAIKETRALSYLMKPQDLSRDGLAHTVRLFAEGFGRRTGLEVLIQADGLVDAATAEVQHAVYRIVQEALANVYRHAGANRVDVELRRCGATLTVLVADDGMGFRRGHDGAFRDAPLGVGISGMRARVEQLGGKFEIGNAETGARVFVAVPVDGPDLL